MSLFRPRAMFIVILIIAFGIRVYSLNFGLPALYDPDEPMFVLGGLKLLKNHTLNPGWFGHPGSTTIYCMALIELFVVIWGMISGRFSDVEAFGNAFYHDPGIIFYPGRWFILICALLCLVLTYFIARKLFDIRTALLASALLAFDPLDIHYSQVIRTDMHASVFMLLALFVTIDIVRRGNLISYVVAGLCIGLACTTKWPAGTALASLVGATTLRVCRDRYSLIAELNKLTVSMVCILAAMFLSSPFLFLDFHTALRDLSGEAQVRHLSTTGGGFLWNAGWYFRVPLQNALGTVGLAMLLPGAFIAARRSREALVVLVPVTLIFYLALCTQGLIQMRWVVPILPMLTILVAVAAFRLIDLIADRTSKFVGFATATLVVGLLVVPTAMTAQAETIERMHDTRRAATDWARAHIPAGSSIAIEYLAFDVLSQPWHFKFPAGTPGCVEVAANLQTQIPYSKIGRWRQNRALVDIGTINPAMIDTCRTDYLILADYDRYIAERGYYEPELSVYQQLMSEGHQVAVFRPVAGQSGGPIVRIIKRDIPVSASARSPTAASKIN